MSGLLSDALDAQNRAAAPGSDLSLRRDRAPLALRGRRSPTGLGYSERHAADRQLHFGLGFRVVRFRTDGSLHQQQTPAPARTVNGVFDPCLSGVDDQDGDTDFDNALRDVNTLMPDPGQGTRAAGDKPQEVLFIVTDGVEDEVANGTRLEQQINARRRPEHFCDDIKARGIQIAVLYTAFLRCRAIPGTRAYRADPAAALAGAAGLRFARSLLSGGGRRGHRGGDAQPLQYAPALGAPDELTMEAPLSPPSAWQTRSAAHRRMRIGVVGVGARAFAAKMRSARRRAARRLWARGIGEAFEGDGSIRNAKQTDPAGARRYWVVVLARYRRIDPLVRFMIAHWVLGGATGIVCAALLLAIDPFGLRPLIAGSDMAALAVALLAFGFASTFGGLVCAAAVMFPDGYSEKTASRRRAASRLIPPSPGAGENRRAPLRLPARGGETADGGYARLRRWRARPVKATPTSTKASPTHALAATLSPQRQRAAERSDTAQVVVEAGEDRSRAGDQAEVDEIAERGVDDAQHRHRRDRGGRDGEDRPEIGARAGRQRERREQRGRDRQRRRHRHRRADGARRFARDQGADRVAERGGERERASRRRVDSGGGSAGRPQREQDAGEAEQQSEGRGEGPGVARAHRPPEKKMKIGAPAIIIAMSALVAYFAATPSSSSGPTWPASDIASSLPQTMAPRGQRARRLADTTISVAAATPTRASAKPTGPKAGAVTLMRRKDVPHSIERKPRAR